MNEKQALSVANYGAKRLCRTARKKLNKVSSVLEEGKKREETKTYFDHMATESG